MGYDTEWQIKFKSETCQTESAEREKQHQSSQSVTFHEIRILLSDTRRVTVQPVFPDWKANV